MNSKSSPWLLDKDDLGSLRELCERADRAEGRTSGPPSRALPLSELMMGTDLGARLLAEARRHPIYRRLRRRVPLVETAPAASRFDPLRRVRTIAEWLDTAATLARPLPCTKRKAKTLRRPDKKRSAELKVIRHPATGD